MGLIILCIIPFSVATKLSLHDMLYSYSFILTPNINTIIAGDSHSEVSLDPDILSKSINISSSGESVFYTYYKLKHFLTLNKGRVRKIVLALSYHNISKKYQEDYLYADEKSDFSLKEYYIYLDKEGKNEIKKSNNYIKYMLKYDLGIPIREYKDYDKYKFLLNKNSSKNNIKGYGGFRSGFESDLSIQRIKNKINTYFYNEDGKYTATSDLIIEYIWKIIALCKNNNIKIYIYNSPLHKDFYSLVPENIINKYNNLIVSFKKKYNNLIVYDVSRKPLKDSYFKDGDHLNKLGSVVISQDFLKFFNNFNLER